jgi:hypothetical protein
VLLPSESRKAIRSPNTESAMVCSRASAAPLGCALGGSGLAENQAERWSRRPGAINVGQCCDKAARQADEFE